MSENKGCIIGILIIVVPFALWYYFVHIPEMDLEEVKKVERKIIQEKINKISDKAKNIATEKGKKDAAIERYDTTIDSSIYYDYYKETFGDSLSDLYINKYTSTYTTYYKWAYTGNSVPKEKKPKSASEQAAYNEGWNRGYNQGYEEGYTNGYIWSQKKK